MIPLTLGEVAAAVGGVLTDADHLGPAGAEARVTGPVVVDSRDVSAGSLFVAVKGERVDGHSYAAQAVAAGAVGVLAARPVGVPAVVVPDVVVALGRLARHVGHRLDATVVALTVLRADEHTDHLVLEMGARGIGHLSTLCEIASPRIGMVLNVGSAHLGEFGSREGVAAAKRELVEALPADGLAVLNADDPLVLGMSERTAAEVVTFGESPQAQVRAERVHLDELGRARFDLLTPEGGAEVALSLVGEHQVHNALAAACVARALGLDTGQVAAGLHEATAASPWRMEVTERADGLVVVNDAYNANPESMRAALKALVAMAHGRRTWAVLGEMRELGASSADEHDTLGRLAVRLGVSRLVVVGEPAKRIHTGSTHEGSFGGESVFVPDVESAVALLAEEVGPADVVLVKASRAVGLERVAAALLDDAEVSR